MSLTIITSGGLSAANVTQGYPTFSIKYFLPIYDHTIDSGIHSTGQGFTSAAPLSGASLVSTTHDTLVGEKIWDFGSGATSAYIVSDDDFRVYEDGGDDSVANNYSGSTQSKSTRTNMVSGTDGIFPISQILSGSASPSVQVDNATGANFTWTNMDVVPGSSVNQNLVLNRSNLWDGVTYAPVETNTDPSERTTAHFICNIPNTAGDFKFNKVALYIQEVDMNGTATSEQPKLFGVSVLNNVVSILDNGGVDAFDLHVKLQFTANNTGTPKNIFYDTDYWNKLPASVSSPYGLFSSGDVAIGTSGIGGSWNPKAKLHLTDNQKPQLTLSKTYTGDEAVFEMKSDGSLGIATSLSAGTLAVGPNTVASGKESVAFGEGGTASGEQSTVMGKGGLAAGTASTSLGFHAVANGHSSVAAGWRTYANSTGATSTGNYTSATGYASLATGLSASAFGSQSVATGNKTSAVGANSSTFGLETIAQNTGSFAIGDKTSATNNYSFASGAETLAEGQRSFATGYKTSAIGDSSFTMGTNNIAEGDNSLVFGFKTTATGTNSFAGGKNGEALGEQSMSIGQGSSAMGKSSFAAGYFNKVGFQNNSSSYGWYSVAFGDSNDNRQYSSLVVGQNNILYPYASDVDAEGCNIVGGDTNVVSTKVKNSFMTGKDNRQRGSHSFVSGELNYLYGNNGNVFGMSNTVGLSGETDSTTFGHLSLAVGKRNDLTGDYSLMGGKDNRDVQVLDDQATNAIRGSYSLTWGETNKTWAKYSITTGISNKAGGDYSAVFGESNENGVNFSATSTSVAKWNLISGQSNIAYNAEHSILVGYKNVVGEASITVANSGNYCGAFGQENKVYGKHSFAFGYNNVIAADSVASNVFGQNNTLYNETNYSLVSGKDHNVQGGTTPLGGDGVRGFSLVTGRGNTASGSFATLLGALNSATSKYVTLIGKSNSSSGWQDFLVGDNNNSTYTNTGASEGGNNVSFGKQNSHKAKYGFTQGDYNQITSAADHGFVHGSYGVARNPYEVVYSVANFNVSLGGKDQVSEIVMMGKSVNEDWVTLGVGTDFGGTTSKGWIPPINVRGYLIANVNHVTNESGYSHQVLTYAQTFSTDANRTVTFGTKAAGVLHMTMNAAQEFTRTGFADSPINSTNTGFVQRPGPNETDDGQIRFHLNTDSTTQSESRAIAHVKIIMCESF